MKHNIILFGCGNVGKRFYNFIGEDNILCFCDNNKAKIGLNFLGKPVISCIELVQMKKDNPDLLIIVTVEKTRFRIQIENDLIESGIMDFVDTLFFEERNEGFNNKIQISKLPDRTARYHYVIRRLHKDLITSVYKCEYLKKHIEPRTLKPAYGGLRKLQIDKLNFCSRLLDFIKSNNNDIEMFLSYGALLGKIRHNGFVPWDDDIDFGLTRENFNLLRCLFRQYNAEIVSDMLYSNHEDETYSAFWDDVYKKADESPIGYVLVIYPFLGCVYGGKKEDYLCIDFFPYDFYEESTTIDEYKNYYIEADSIRKNGDRVSDIVFNLQKEREKSGIVSPYSTDKIAPGNDALVTVGIYKFDRFLNYDDIFPIKEDTFENVALPFPNNPVKLVEQCYGESWEKLPDDVGENHSGIIMNG